jgi:hypothetical protein
MRETMAMTVITPMIIPSAVRNERIRWVRKVSRERRRSSIRRMVRGKDKVARRNDKVRRKG